MGAYKPMRRLRLQVQGQVQGVGFRPFAFTLARRFRLTGNVGNTPEGVLICVQGESADVDGFSTALQRELPPLAVITGLMQEEVPPLANETEFSILPTVSGHGHTVLISPDAALCAACREDMQRQGDRRFGYAFTNCTNCGPRYSITRSMPYDRENTSMACFPMCETCAAEYRNPADRRFHAQPNACPVCGPQVWFVPHVQKNEDQGTEENVFSFDSTQAGEKMLARFSRTHAASTGAQAIEDAAALLAGGKVLAVKGLGGFHLACDALNAKAVAILRKNKNRPHKPFAVMTADMRHARLLADMTAGQETLLTSSAAPIVLCPLSSSGAALLGNGISPDTRDVGIMLPYTPLHQALFTAYAACNADAPCNALVMTSGNRSGEPLCTGNREAVETLSGFADGFLLHDRDILIRVDDSVIHANGSEKSSPATFLRRARGYVPKPVRLPPLPEGRDEPPCVLGAGADLKNTLCLTKGNLGFVSQHIGDMESLAANVFYREILAHLTGLLQVAPELAVHDLHPGYASTALARAMGLPTLPLQHHAAHGHAVLAENNFSGKALVLAMDGTGMGEDGTLWGGELLCLDTESLSHTRLAHLASVPLAGGEQAIREPWRIAHAMLLHSAIFRDMGETDRKRLFPWLEDYARTARLLPDLLEQRAFSPLCTSAGRLFDAVSAALGLCPVVSYEGQAAIRLEQAQYAGESGSISLSSPGQKEAEAQRALGLLGLRHVEELLPVSKSDNSGECTVLDSYTFFERLVTLRLHEVPCPVIAGLFHEGLAAGMANAAVIAAKRQNIGHVGLSGGCMQNATLVRLLARSLHAHGLQVLMHQALPPGDGCISLGQAAYGRLWLSQHA